MGHLSFNPKNVATIYAQGAGPSRIAQRFQRKLGFVKNFLKTQEFLDALAMVTAKKEAEKAEIRAIAAEFSPLVSARNKFVDAAPKAADKLVEMLDENDKRLVKEVALDISKGLGVLKGETQTQPVVQISISDQKIAILEESLRLAGLSSGEIKPREDK